MYDAHGDASGGKEVFGFSMISGRRLIEKKSSPLDSQEGLLVQYIKYFFIYTSLFLQYNDLHEHLHLQGAIPALWIYEV